MGKIILDCDLMRFPNSGLYHYCLNIGHYVNLLLDKQGREHMKFYVPSAEADTFAKRDTIIEKANHKFFKPFLWDCKVWHAPFQLGRILPKNKNIKVLLTIHDLNFLHEGKSLEEQRNTQAHVQSLINRADAIVCISEFSKSDVLQHCDVNNKPIYAIHNGTHKVGDAALHHNSYQPKKPFLFGMGYVNQKKNYGVLMPLLEQNEDLELVVAGRLDDPEYIATMQQQAKEKGISDRLHILGPVSESEKAWYLKHCTAFVHPSLAEGFGAPVVEAMLFGKPLFLSNLTSLPEIGGDVAFYFQNFEPEHMQLVFKQGLQQYQQNGMVEKIISRGNNFNWNEKAIEYLKVYQSLL
ncbi:MAG TPA: glycosyltransferase family 1 protein [Chitinophagaceae bacterium]|jgi:glycosyltransferase involved in cell wall biosynthesis|nr:glycosyltransferase family 1 protein [Chitinophagaceae bacterium]